MKISCNTTTTTTTSNNNNNNNNNIKKTPDGQPSPPEFFLHRSYIVIETPDGESDI